MIGPFLVSGTALLHAPWISAPFIIDNKAPRRRSCVERWSQPRSAVMRPLVERNRWRIAHASAALPAGRTSQANKAAKDDPRQLVLDIQRSSNWRALKQLHYQRVCISHPLLSVTVLCKLPSLVLPVHALLTNADIRELQEFVAFLLGEVDNVVLKKAYNRKLPAQERSKLTGLLVKCLYALSLMDLPGCPKREWLPRLCSGILNSSDILKVSDAATCLWALSQLRGVDAAHGDVLDMADFGVHVLQHELPNLSLQQTAWLLLGVAMLKRKVPRALLDNVVQHATEQFSKAKQGIMQEPMWDMADDEAGTLLQALSDLFTAMAQLKYYPSSETMTDCIQDTELFLEPGTSAAVSNLLFAIVKLGHRPSHEWMQEYFKASASQLGRYKGSVLSQQAWAVTQMDVNPPLNWLSNLSSAVSLRGQLLELADLATCCRCLRHYEFQPPAAQLGNIIAALPDAASLDTDQLFLVLGVYACCGVRPKQALADKLEVATKQLLGTLTLEQFSTMVLALRRPGWSSGRQLVDKFLTRSISLMPAASPPHLVGFLQALKAASYLCWDKTRFTAFVNRVYQVATELSPLQCLSIVEGVTVLGLWPYTELLPAGWSGSVTPGNSGMMAVTGPMRAMAEGSTAVTPVVWLSAILDRLSPNVGLLQPVQCVMLLCSLRKLASASTRYAHEMSAAAKPLLFGLEKQLTGKLQDVQSASSLAELCLGFTLLGHSPSSAFLAEWTLAVTRRAKSLTAADITLVLRGISRLPEASRKTCYALVDQVVRAAASQADVAPDDVVEVLTLAVQIGAGGGTSSGTSSGSSWKADGALLDALAQKLKLRWGQMLPVTLAKAVKVLATVGCQVPSSVLQLHVNAMYPQARSASMECVMDVVWSYKQLGFSLKSSQQDKLLVTVAQASPESLRLCGAAPLIASMQDLHKRGMGRLSEWTPVLETALSKDLPSLSCSDVVDALLLFESQSYQPTDAVANRMAAAMNDLDPKGRARDVKLAGNALRVFAEWGQVIPQTRWLSLLSQLQQVTGASARVLQAWVWQFYRVGFTPSDDWLAAVLSVMFTNVSGLDAAGVVQFMESLCGLRVWNKLAAEQRQVLLDSLWQHSMVVCKEVSSSQDVQHFCAMLHWLTCIGYSPDSEGREWLNSRLKQQKKLLPFYTTQQLVWLLGSLAPLGNANTFMAQELRAALASRAASTSLSTSQLAEGLAAVASAPGPVSNRLAQNLQEQIWVGLSGARAEEARKEEALPEFVWALARLQVKLQGSELRRVCKEVAVCTSFNGQQICRLVEGLTRLAGPSLWDAEVYGAAATGQLLDQLCCAQVVRERQLSVGSVVELLQNLLTLGHTPGTDFLDAMLEYLLQIDPLARQITHLLPALSSSPHIQHLPPDKQQQLYSCLASFGYDPANTRLRNQSSGLALQLSRQEMQASGYSTNIKESDYSTNMKESDYRTNMKESDYSTNTKESDYRTNMKESDYRTNIESKNSLGSSQAGPGGLTNEAVRVWSDMSSQPSDSPSRTGISQTGISQTGISQTGISQTGISTDLKSSVLSTPAWNVASGSVAGGGEVTSTGTARKAAGWSVGEASGRDATGKSFHGAAAVRKNVSSKAASIKHAASKAAGKAASTKHAASKAAGRQDVSSKAAGRKDVGSEVSRKAAGAEDAGSKAAGRKHVGSNNTISKAAGSNNTISKAAGSNNTISKAAGSNNTISKAAGSNNTISKAAGSNNTISKAVGSNNTISKAADSNNTISKAASQKHAVRNSTISQAAGSKAARQKHAGSNSTISQAAGSKDASVKLGSQAVAQDQATNQDQDTNRGAKGRNTPRSLVPSFGSESQQGTEQRKAGQKSKATPAKPNVPTNSLSRVVEKQQQEVTKAKEKNLANRGGGQQQQVTKAKETRLASNAGVNRDVKPASGSGVDDNGYVGKGVNKKTGGGLFNGLMGVLSSTMPKW